MMQILNILTSLLLGVLVDFASAAEEKSNGKGGGQAGGKGGAQSGQAGGAAKGGSSGGQNARVKLSAHDNAENHNFAAYLQAGLGSLAAIFLVYHLVFYIIRYVRTVTCIRNDSQRYFAIPNATYAWFKQHFLYAPIWHKRHNNEMRLSEATNFGTLPSLFQAVFLTAYLGANVALCVVSVNWGEERKKVLVQLRNRSGVLAVVNMVPLFVLAGRNNPLIPLLGISFDTFNLLHRWFGRVVVLESLCHTGAYLAGKTGRGNRTSRDRRILSCVPHKPLILLCAR
jgi:hypothetical protein